MIIRLKQIHHTVTTCTEQYYNQQLQYWVKQWWYRNDNQVEIDMLYNCHLH